MPRCFPCKAAGAGAKPGVDEAVVKVAPKIAYFLCFVALMTAAALALNRVLQPSMSEDLLRAVIVAALAGAPGLVHRKAWPAAPVLLVLGAYLVVRTTVPLPDAAEGWRDLFSFYSGQLAEGRVAYLEDVFPLRIAEVPGLKLLFALSVYVLSGVASLLALSLRRAIPAVVLGMVLLGYSLTVDTAWRVLWLAVLFLVLAACLLVFSRGLHRTNWRLRDTLAGGTLGVVASLLALLLLTAAPSAVAVPWQDWRTWDPFNRGGSVFTFNWMQNYPQLLDPAQDRVIMQVRSPSPSYWRANALDVFTGNAWVTSQAFLAPVEPEHTAERWVYVLPEAGPVPPGVAVTESFSVEGVYTNFFFAGGDPTRLTLQAPVTLRMNAMRALHATQSLGPTLQYTLETVIPELKPEDIMAKGRDYPEAVLPYLTLPFPRLAELPDTDETTREAAWGELAPSQIGPSGWEWAGLYGLNDRIVQGATDPYQVTLRLERHLRRQYEYSLVPPVSEYSSPYAAFLFDTRSGYCQHFAGTMALLLRYNGIPARVAVGFTTGDRGSGDIYTVSTNNAHAWVEAYFPTVGWVAFDPTPGRNIPSPGPSSTSPGFINPFPSTGDTGGEVTATTEPRPSPTTGGVRPDEQGGAAETSHWYGPAWLPWILGLLAVAWPMGRSLWLRRDLYRGPLDARLSTSMRLLRTDLAAYGLPASPSATIEETVRLVESDLALNPEPGFVERTEAVLFGGREAARDDIATAETFRGKVRDALRRRHGWVRTGLAWYGLSRRRSPSRPESPRERVGVR